MNNKIISSKKVFIASSHIAHENGRIEPIISVLRNNGYSVFPWYEAIQNNEWILESILNFARKIDFAICFFDEDVAVKQEGTEFYGTAWNVVLEYGVFLQELGRDRVKIIQYGSSKAPSDLAGMKLNNIKSNSFSIDNEIKKRTLEIVRQWETIPAIHDDGLGIISPIADYREKLKTDIHFISTLSESKSVTKPLELDERLIVDLYTSGLKNVEKRFWTTTYLSSGFWVHKSYPVLNANRELLSRLSNRNERDVKRLFIIRHPFEEEKEILKRKLVDYKSRKDNIVKLEQHYKEFRSLRDSCEEMIRMNCEVRYAYQNPSLPLPIHDEKIDADTEIAIYDNFRVDFFGGAMTKKIGRIRTYTNKHHNFDGFLNNAENVFTDLWERGENIDSLLADFDEIHKTFERKVDYTFEKLLKFDNNFNHSDKLIKDAEMTCVKNHLSSKDYWNNVFVYLDIGTCTGRYPFELKNLFSSKDCLIWGFDANPDCIEYLQVKKKIIEDAQQTEFPNLIFKEENFLANRDMLIEDGKKFNLITCMLGTISHFGRQSHGNLKTHLQTALEKMKAILAKNGLLIISNWTSEGIKNNMLSIYNENDLTNLKEGTESTFSLRKRLELMGMTVTRETVGPKGELDILFIRLSDQ